MAEEILELANRLKVFSIKRIYSVVYQYSPIILIRKLCFIKWNLLNFYVFARSFIKHKLYIEVSMHALKSQKETLSSTVFPILSQDLPLNSYFLIHVTSFIHRRDIRRNSDDLFEGITNFFT